MATPTAAASPVSRRASSSSSSRRHRPKRVPLIVRPPGPRAPRHQLISTFHSLLRQRSSLPASHPSLSSVDAALDELGGLASYQAASISGHSGHHHGGFNTSKWIVERLAERGEWKQLLRQTSGRRRKRRRQEEEGEAVRSQAGDEEKEEGRDEQGGDGDAFGSSAPPTALHRLLRPPPLDAERPRRPRLLDVGSMTNHYLHLSHRIDVLPIDISPQHPSVLHKDFFELPFSSLSGSFDVVVLSLVLNFVPSIARRGSMLRLTSRLLREGGLVYVVLPSACLLNSRWVDEAVMRSVMNSCGLQVEWMRWSARLVMLEARKVRGGVAEGMQGGYQPRQVRRGDGFNNFSISLPPSGGNDEEVEEQKGQEASGREEEEEEAPASETPPKLGKRTRR